MLLVSDSLNVNGFSTLVICISALKNDVSETVNSLTFAQKVMNLKNNPKILPVLQPDSKVSLSLVMILQLDWQLHFVVIRNHSISAMLSVWMGIASFTNNL